MAGRQEQLVSQHLENVSRKVLEKYQAIIRSYVRRRHGVYALYRKNRLYYVGLASNLRSRLHRHLRDRHGQTWDRFSVYLTINDKHLKELEALVLRIAAPKGNLQKGRFPRSEDLRRRFRRQVTVFHRSELESLFELAKPLVPRKEPTKSDGKAVLAKYVNGPLKLRWTYKGKAYKARVRLDGRIRFQGRVFNSPSTAASSITRRAMNGWSTWRFERGPGEWVPLDELRR